MNREQTIQAVLAALAACAIGLSAGPEVRAEPWCATTGLAPFEVDGSMRSSVSEQEPNDLPGEAQVVSVPTGEGGVTVDATLDPEDPMLDPEGDIDHFLVSLNAGDLLMTEAMFVNPPNGSALRLRITILQGSTELFTIDEDDSPQVGRVRMPFIAPSAGPFLVRVSLVPDLLITFDTFPAPYQVKFLRSLPGPVSAGNGARQVFFVDFDGHEVVPSLFAPGGGTTLVALSPMSAFLDDWCLQASDEDAVIDSVIAKIRENFVEVSKNRPFSFAILNSRDHADPGDAPNVSRVIIGGTRAEMGLPPESLLVGSAGITTDFGNRNLSDDAVILLDILSDPECGGYVQVSCFQDHPLPQTEIVGRAVGNIASHEIGHLLGNWHTLNTNEVYCLMDSGGGTFARTIFQTGPDGQLGTEDDDDSRFTIDVGGVEPFFPSGLQDTEFHVGAALMVTCPADINRDEVVNGADMGILLGAWGTPNPLSDLNGDGTVDGDDLSILMADWGPCPGT